MPDAYAAWAARWRVPLGFVLGIAFVFLSHPTSSFLPAGAIIAFLGLSLRAYAAGYLEKSRELATSGPYRYTRNPLYLGSFFIGLGFAVAGRSWVLGLIFVCFFILIYGPVMRREEFSLRRQFGEAYDRYANSVALFLPTFIISSNAPKDSALQDGFRWERYWRNHEYEAALGYLCGLVFLVIKLRMR
ncbi:MAG TPA: isoprenylcysteine carboxylmethyltransferase family protein [Terriglobia bacterium]|nr:isoprenylcysteine carboxylmethyltransferase family protein [Terriglobia bacterium]